MDLGAHRGYYTLLAAKFVGEQGRVFAFEPSPENFTLMSANLKGRSNVSLIPRAVSNTSGTTRLFLDNNDSLSDTIYDTDEGRNCIDVEVVSLDDFFKDKDSRVDIIKMDVEGAEMDVLKGMNQVIKKNANLKIITEFCPCMLQQAGASPAGYLNRLTEHGFRLYLIDEEKKTIKLRSAAEIIAWFQDDPQRLSINLLCEYG